MCGAKLQPEEVGVEASVVLQGLSSQDFGAAQRSAFTEGVAETANVQPQQVEITDVRDVSRKRRSVLQTTGNSQIDVKFVISGLATEAQAEQVSDLISDGSNENDPNSPGSLVSNLQQNGLSGITVVTVTPPNVVVLSTTVTNVTVESSGNLMVIAVGE